VNILPIALGWFLSYRNFSNFIVLFFSFYFSILLFFLAKDTLFPRQIRMERFLLYQDRQQHENV